jgi:hypothetical protein
MTEIKDSSMGSWEHAAAVRRMVEELPEEDQRQGARFNHRSWALHAAAQEINREKAIATDEYRAEVALVLEELRAEVDAAFRAWRQERGIPEL